MYEHVKENYDVELNYNKLMWGSIAPDIMPRYKLKRHYFEDSFDYIVFKIAKVIFLNRFLDFNKCDYRSLKLFSRDIGIISHYLADFTCIAHAEEWSMPKYMVKHLKYEKELNEYSKKHNFNKNIINIDPLQIDDSNIFSNLSEIKEYVRAVLTEYMNQQSMARDLDYALSLNIVVFEFIIESILVHNTDLAMNQA